MKSGRPAFKAQLLGSHMTIKNLFFRIPMRILISLGFIKRYNTLSPIKYLDRLKKFKDVRCRYLHNYEDALHFNDNELLIRSAYNNVPFYFYCLPNSVIENIILEDGIFDKAVLDLMSDHIKSNSIVIDVGANIGAYTIPLAVLNPTIDIHSFEPNPYVADRLRRNISVNQITNVTVHQEGLSNNQGVTQFHVIRPSENMTYNLGLSSIAESAVQDQDTDKIEIAINTIDNIFSDSDKHVSLLKVDVQGFEFEVLKGAEITINKYRPVIIIEHETVHFDSNEKAEEATMSLNKFFEDNKYNVFYFNVKYGSQLLAPVRWEHVYNSNLIAIPSS